MAESAPTAFISQPPPSSPNAQSPPLPDKYVFPSHLPTPPFIDIDGVPNFRDIGGYLTSSSYFSNATPMMVRKNLIYRCAHPQLLTSEGISTLSTLGIKHIFDLRSAPEVKKLSATLPDLAKTDAPTNPDSDALTPKGLSRYFTPVYEEDDYGPVALATKLEWYTSKPTGAKLNFEYSEGFVNAYRDIAMNATYSKKRTAAYPVILRQIIENPEEPLVFHCTAGKDRTGVLAAILLRLAGVDDETIAWEYALTEIGLGSWRELFIQRISMGGLGQAGTQPKSAEAKSENDAGQNGSASAAKNEAKPKMSREEAARICGSRAGNIKAFLKLVVDGEWGGHVAYLREKCGLSEEEVEKLRNVLLVPVENVQDVVQIQKVRGWTPDGGVQDMTVNENSGPTEERHVMAG